MPELVDRDPHAELLERGEPVGGLLDVADDKITHVGIPDSNINQLTPEQLALGSDILTRLRIHTLG